MGKDALLNNADNSDGFSKDDEKVIAILGISSVGNEPLPASTCVCLLTMEYFLIILGESLFIILFIIFLLETEFKITLILITIDINNNLAYQSLIVIVISIRFNQFTITIYPIYSS